MAVGEHLLSNGHFLNMILDKKISWFQKLALLKIGNTSNTLVNIFRSRCPNPISSANSRKDSRSKPLQMCSIRYVSIDLTLLSVQVFASLYCRFKVLDCNG